MKALLLTNEYPPFLYGGAGVHIHYLSRELAQLMEVEVRCFGHQQLQQPQLSVVGNKVETSDYQCPSPLHPAFAATQQCLNWNTQGVQADCVHCHTWYTQLGGVWAKLNYGIPLILTVHSLEPLRPWKREQLGRGYDFSCWIEHQAMEMADAIIAVSEQTRQDILRLFGGDPARVHLIHNGIDAQEYTPTSSTAALQTYGVDPDLPYVLFLGRLTRQKGITYLLQAIKYLTPKTQVVFCVGAPDTPEIAQETKALVAEVTAQHPKVLWIEAMLDTHTAIEMYSHAAVFCCPSIYEPFGIINLEAMACETAVVAAKIGGIPEVVLHEETGLLVPLEQEKEPPFTPQNPDRYARDLAAAINQLMANPDQRNRFAIAGRQRALDHFSWSAIARQTQALYQRLLDEQRSS